MKITKRLIRKIILEEFLNEEKDNQEYHAAAEFFESNYGVSYEDFFEARDSRDFSKIAESIYENGVFTPLTQKFPMHPVAQLTAIDELYRSNSLSESLYKAVVVSVIETTLALIAEGGVIPGGVLHSRSAL